MIQLDVVDPWKLRAATNLTGISEQMIKGQTIVYESRVRDQRIEAMQLKEAPVNNQVPGIINVDAESTVISDLATPSFTDTTKSNVSVKSKATSLKYKKLMDEQAAASAKALRQQAELHLAMMNSMRTVQEKMRRKEC